MTKQIKNAKSIQKKSRTHRVRLVWGTMYQVVSGASGRTYYVKLTGEGASCDCKWGTRGGKKLKGQSACSHVTAVYDHIESEKSRTVSAAAYTTSGPTGYSIVDVFTAVARASLSSSRE